MQKLHKNYAQSCLAGSYFPQYMPPIAKIIATPYKRTMDMAAYHSTRSTYGIDVVAGRIGAVLANVYAAVIDWNDTRVTRNALAALTDRELDDIGLVRGDIDDVATARRLF